ncbi:unnamed protein product [Allacma fusca]|uniref:Uncharacterized protein n=1 Tax=Allacma fusca TaxID=39272 RepID=A0A8J2JZM2_9HEXA|nr:unnamed protein product [Allacma fusca]
MEKRVATTPSHKSIVKDTLNLEASTCSSHVIRVSPVLKCPSYYEKCWRNKNSSVVDLNDYRQAGGIRKLLGPKFEDVDALDRASVWNQLNSHYGSMSYTSYQSVKGVDLKNYVIIHPSLLQRLLRPQSCNCASKRKVTAAGQNVKRLGNTTRGKGKQPKKPAISKPLKKKKVQDNLRAKKFYKCIFYCQAKFKDMKDSV